MIPVDPRVRRQAGDTNGGGRRTRDGASRLALTNIGSGRYVPFSENPPGQPVALECPECPRGGVRPAAEFVRQFCLRRQLGPRRVFAAPDPPREHGVNVLVDPRVLPRIIHDQSHGQCNDPSPEGLLVFHLEHPRVAAPTDVYARVTPSLGRRQMRTFEPSAAMYEYTAVQGPSRAATEGCRVGQWREGVLITARRPARYVRSCGSVRVSSIPCGLG
jgi:hypothetical protein